MNSAHEMGRVQAFTEVAEAFEGVIPPPGSGTGAFAALEYVHKQLNSAGMSDADICGDYPKFADWCGIEYSLET